MTTALDRPPEEAAEDTSFARGLRVLLTIADRGEIRADELSTLLETPLSTIYRYLRTLAEFGFVDRQEGGYRLGPRLHSSGAGASSRPRSSSGRRPGPGDARRGDRRDGGHLPARRARRPCASTQSPSPQPLRVVLEPGPTARSTPARSPRSCSPMPRRRSRRGGRGRRGPTRPPSAGAAAADRRRRRSRGTTGETFPGAADPRRSRPARRRDRGRARGHRPGRRAERRWQATAASCVRRRDRGIGALAHARTEGCLTGPVLSRYGIGTFHHLTIAVASRCSALDGRFRRAWPRLRRLRDAARRGRVRLDRRRRSRSGRASGTSSRSARSAGPMPTRLRLAEFDERAHLEAAGGPGLRPLLQGPGRDRRVVPVVLPVDVAGRGARRGRPAAPRSRRSPCSTRCTSATRSSSCA